MSVEPATEAVNVALPVVQALVLDGCETIEAALLTVNVTLDDVSPAGPQLDITTWYWLLFCPAATLFNVSVEVVSPARSVNVAPPSVLTCH